MKFLNKTSLQVAKILAALHFPDRPSVQVEERWNYHRGTITPNSGLNQAMTHIKTEIILRNVLRDFPRFRVLISAKRSKKFADAL